MKFFPLQCLLLISVISACKSEMNPKLLYGKWKYVKLENPDANPPETMPAFKLQFNHPSIEFTRDNQLIMLWKDSVISHGTYQLEKDQVKFKERLSDGSFREFPLIIKTLTDHQLVFQTNGEDGSRVTAVK
jgi:hypothetical protein